jgi:hypothetical protein
MAVSAVEGMQSQPLVAKYTHDYVGGVQLLQKSGFSPFQEKAPLNSALNQIFSQLADKTAMPTNAEKLRSEFLQQNPDLRRTYNLYDALEKTFSSSSQENSPIVTFINEKIDQNVKSQAGKQTPAETKKSTQSMQQEFYSNFSQLNNLLGYFKTTPGNLIDTYA